MRVSVITVAIENVRVPLLSRRSSKAAVAAAGVHDRR